MRCQERTIGTKKGNVLLDSGVQISLICASTAKTLGLKEKDVSITIKKVGSSGTPSSEQRASRVAQNDGRTGSVAQEDDDL